MGERGEALPPAAPPALPDGTVTFLFTDLEGSTRLLEAHPTAYKEAVRRHHDLLRGAVEGHGGAVFETLGDAVYAAFARPTDAVAAALAGQLALRAEDWGAVGELRARMGVHLGEVERQGGHYFGAPLYRCARLTATAHGGQTVLSAAVAEAVRDALPEGAALRDLGAHRLKDLARAERVAQLLHSELPADFPPLRALDALGHNLPLQLTSFVGREREVAAVARLLAVQRLVTLTGVGGCGKTRLALQAAADTLPDYPDGVWLVELAALADPGLVPQAVAAAVGVREEAGRPLLATLTDALRPRRLLLVLDNCEHLLDACAHLADAVLRVCPELHVLATSREALGVAGEAPYRVPSLALPDPRHPPPAEGLAPCEAVALFAERARLVQPAFRVTGQHAPAVAQLCVRLDGIPLAIELAAARVHVLPPARLLARLEDRFRLLTGGSRTVLPRHQTLRAAVDWSYALLPDHERRLFARLAVFAGGFSLEAAEQVGAGDGIGSEAVLELLTRLVDKSLVVVDEQPDGATRFQYLETIRQYALERLEETGELAAARSRHRDWYLRLGEHTPPPGMYTAAHARDLAPEQDNLRAALRWSIERGDAAAGLRLGAALSQIWYVRGNYSEGQARLLELLALPQAAAVAAIRAGILDAAGHLAYCQGDLATARALLDESQAIWRRRDDQEHLAVSLSLLANVVRYRSDLAGAQALYEEARAINHRLGNRLQETMNVALLAQVRFEQGDVAQAEALTLESLPTFEERGHQWGLVLSACMLGRVAARRGDHATARARLEECLERARSLGIVQGMIWPPYFLAQHALDRGAAGEARLRFAESLRLAAECGDQLAMVHGLEGMAGSLAATQPERAIRLAAAAGGLRDHLGAAPFPADRRRLDRWRRAAWCRVGEAAYNVASAAGRELSLAQAVADALEEVKADA